MPLKNKTQLPTTKKSLNPQWVAKQDKALSLSKQISSGTNIAAIEMDVTLEQTLSKPVIRDVFKGDKGGSYIFGVVKVLVQRFCNSFSFSTKLTDDQIEKLTVDTLTHFEYESLEDIILFFKKSRTGAFGISKTQISSNLIFGEWFPKYLEEKATYREDLYASNKAKQNGIIVTEADVKKTYSEINKRIYERQVDAYIDNITKHMDRQMLEDTIVSWSKSAKTKPYVYKLKLKRKTIK